MKRNNNGKRGRRPARRSAGFILPYKETVLSRLLIDADNTGYVAYYSGDLLPGLDTASDDSRVIVPRRVIVETLPNFEGANSIVTAQVQAGTMFMDTGDQLLNSTSFGTVPFKIMSAVNPTRYVFDFRQAGRICPFVLKPIRPLFRSTDTRSFIRFAYNAIGAFTRNVEVTLRITTFVDVLPQDNLLVVVPFPVSRSADQSVQKVDRLEEVDDPSLGC
jgi:hypothetical protein